MSKYTSSPAYTDQERADMIQCYLESGKKIKVTQMYYTHKYPTRRIPTFYTLKKIVGKYLNTVASISISDLQSKQTYSSSDKDNRIVNYFLENCHATIKKAAIIFNVGTYYIQKLLKERKVEIQRNKDHGRRKGKRRNLNNKIVLKEIKKSSDKSEMPTTSHEKLSSNTNLTKNRQNFLNKEKQNEITTKNEDDTIDVHDDFADLKIELENEQRESKNKEVSMEMKRCKRRIANNRVNEIIKYVARKKRKKNIQDENTSEQENVINPFVYTTRLEEMNILRNGVNNFSTIYILAEILRESKPTYKNTLIRKSVKRNKMSFKMLQKVLQELTNEWLTWPTKNFLPFTTTRPEANDNFQMSYVYKEGDKIFNLTRTHDVVIIINSLYLNSSDVYVTDSDGKILEYYTIKYEEQDILKTIDQYKMRITLNTCCWYYRQDKIDLLFRNTSCSFSRFLKTTHDCGQALCTCCCKPTDQIIDSVPKDTKLMLKHSNTELCEIQARDSNLFRNKKLNMGEDNLIFKESNLNNKKLKKGDDNLITKAYSYCNNTDKIIPIEQNFSRVSSISYKPISNPNILTKFRFTENIPSDSVKSICEYYEIGLDKNIMYQTIYITEPTIQSFHRKFKGIPLFSNSNDVSNVSVCCKSRRDRFLLGKYNKSMLSANSLRYLKIPITPNICGLCEKRESKPKESLKLEIKLPNINHTRQCIKSSLFQINRGENNFEEQNKTTAHMPNIVNNESKKVLSGLKKTANQKIRKRNKRVNKVVRKPKDATNKVLCNTTITKCPLKTIQLIVNCIQLPTFEIIMKNVEYGLAAQLIIQFSSMSVSIREDKKVVATFNTDISTLSMDTYNILADILRAIQIEVHKSGLPVDTKLNLFGRIETENNQTNLIDCTIFQVESENPIINNTKICDEHNKSRDSEDQMTVNKQSTHSTNILKALLTRNSDDRQNLIPHIYKNKIADTYEYTNGNLNHKSNTVSDNNTLKEFEIDIPYSIGQRNNANIVGISSIVKDKIDNLDFAVNAANLNTSKAAVNKNIRKIFIKDTNDPNNTYEIRGINSNTYNRFSELQRYHKNCYKKSFQSYLKPKHQDDQNLDTVTPKISNVFSLSATNTDKNPSSITGNQSNVIMCNDSNKPSTCQTPHISAIDIISKDTNSKLAITSNSDDVIRNTKNPCNPLLISPQSQPVLTYNSQTNIAHVYSTSKAITSDAVDRLRSINSTQSFVINQGDCAVLTPITVKQTIISQPSMTVYQQQSEPKQLCVPMPDAIKDIPEGSDDAINIADEIFVKEENEIVILDSD